MPNGQMKPENRPPFLMVAFGRQRVGTTTLLNAVAQYWRDQGNSIRVWDADDQNRIQALRHVFPDAEVAPGSGLQDAKDWIEARIADLIQHRYDAVLDIGSGVTEFTQLVHEARILKALERSSIRMIALLCLGPDKADLEYLNQVARISGFLPPATVIVLNSGVVVSGQPAEAACEWLLEHEALLSAFERGATLAVMPALSCMTAVTDRGLTFGQAMAGDTGTGRTPLSLFDRARVNMWWTEKMPEFFRRLPTGAAALGDSNKASRWTM